VFERPGIRWEDNIKTDFKESELVGMNWIRVAQSRSHWLVFVNAIFEHLNSINGGQFVGWLSNR